MGVWLNLCESQWAAFSSRASAESDSCKSLWFSTSTTSQLYIRIISFIHKGLSTLEHITSWDQINSRYKTVYNESQVLAKSKPELCPLIMRLFFSPRAVFNNPSILLYILFHFHIHSILWFYDYWLFIIMTSVYF